MSDITTNNKRIVKNSILLSMRMVFVMVISLYISRVTLQNLGIEDFGIYNVVCGFVLMFSFLSSAMTSGIQRFFNYEFGKNGPEGANKVFVSSLQSQALLAFVLVALLESVGVWYISYRMVIPANRLLAAKLIYQMSILSMIVTIFQAPFDAAIMAHEEMGFYAFLSIMNQILKLIIVLLLPYFPGDTLITYGFLFFIISLIDFVASIVYSRYRYKEIRLVKVFHKDLFKEMFVFSGWDFLGEFALTMKEQGLNLILNLFFGPVVNAARGLAFQVTSALNGFVANISFAIKPQMTQSYAKGDQKRAYELMFSNTKIGFIILYLLALPVSLEIDFILELWLGTNVPAYTDSFIIIIFFITLLNGMQGNVSFVVHAKGNLRLFSVITSLVTLLVIPFGYFVLKIGYGPNSVFWISLLITFLNYIASVVVLNRIMPFSIKEYFLRVSAPLFIMAMVALPIPLLIRVYVSEGWWRLLIIILTSSICTILAAFFISLNREERQFVTVLFKNKVRRLNYHSVF